MFALPLSGVISQWWKRNAKGRGHVQALWSFLVLFGEFIRDSMPTRRRASYGDMDFDWDYRVDTTSGTVSWRARLLGMFHSPYQPTAPQVFHEILQNLLIDYSEFVFEDLGSGKGRTLLMASDYPFRRIVGVELLPELHRIAQGNIQRYTSVQQKCFEIEAICCDARDFRFPKEPTLLYLFNPFPEEVLDQVISSLGKSIESEPRVTYVVYYSPMYERVLERPWLQKLGGTDQYSVYKASR